METSRDQGREERDGDVVQTLSFIQNKASVVQVSSVAPSFAFKDFI